MTQREMNFRAWDKIHRRWLDLWQLIFWSTGDLATLQDIDGEVYGLHQIVLIQYTGLKDKQGKKIYEGDIVTIIQDGEEVNTGVIECDAPDGGYNIRDRDAEYIGIDSNTVMIIIGNIYEHSYLLDTKTEK